MSLILNEYEWAESKLRDLDLGVSPSETIFRIAKYYHANHYTNREIRRRLEEFLIQCNPHISLIKWTDIIDKAVKNTKKYKLVMIDGVSISKTEMAKIKELRSVPLQRLAFTLLCVSKYWDLVSDRNNHWVNTSDSEVLKMANVRTSVLNQSLMFGELKEAGLIGFSKKIDNLNVQVYFSDNDEEALFVHDFRNLGFQYSKYAGGPYYECANCGITYKGGRRHKTILPTAGRPRKYCPSCANEARIKQNVNSVMRHRSAQEL